MTNTYLCPPCGVHHDLHSPLGQQHLVHALSKEDAGRFLEFSASAGAHAMVVANTEQYVRDVEVFRVLGEKFSESGNFAGPDQAKAWLEGFGSGSNEFKHIMMKLQGDGAGEVDALRAINGSLRGIFQRAEFITNDAGRIASNTPGVDLQVVNRFTGEVIEQIQVKSNWTDPVANLRGTIRTFQNGSSYSEAHVLAGPKELINEARKMGLQNPMQVVGDTQGNVDSGERLMKLIGEKAEAVHGTLTVKGVAVQTGQGALIGAAVSVGVEALVAFLAYRRGEITREEAFKRIGISASRGAVVGAALGGLSVVFPPGAIGIGVGIVVGQGLRRIVDVAYGRGAYEDILKLTGAIEATVASTSSGTLLLESSIREMKKAQDYTREALADSDGIVSDTDAMLGQLEAFERGEW